MSTCRLSLADEGKVAEFSNQRGVDATEHGSIFFLLNPRLLREAGIYYHGVPWKFGGNQCAESKGDNIPLKYLPSRGKIFLELITDVMSLPEL